MEFIENMLYDSVADYVVQIYSPLDSTILDWLYVGAQGAKTAELVAEGGLCHNIFNALTMFAGVLLLIYLFTSLTDKIMKELASTQVAVKALMELLVASIILLHGYSLVSGFACMGDDIINFINNGTEENSVSTDIMKSAAKTYNVLILCEKYEKNDKVTYEYFSPNAKTLRSINKIDKTRSHYSGGNNYHDLFFPDYGSTNDWDDYLEDASYASNLLKLMVFNLVSTLIQIAAIAASVGRLIQIAVYISLSPIAIVNVFGEGMHSQGIRFFKKLFACSLEGPAMVVILLISSTFTLGSGKGIVTFIAIQLATLMALFKASTFASDIVL